MSKTCSHAAPRYLLTHLGFLTSLPDVCVLSEKRNTAILMMLAYPGHHWVGIHCAIMPALSPDLSRFAGFFVEHQCVKREEEYGNFHNACLF